MESRNLTIWATLFAESVWGWREVRRQRMLKRSCVRKDRFATEVEPPYGPRKNRHGGIAGAGISIGLDSVKGVGTDGGCYLSGRDDRLAGLQLRIQDDFSLADKVCCSQPKESKVGSNAKEPVFRYTFSSKIKSEIGRTGGVREANESSTMVF